MLYAVQSTDCTVFVRLFVNSWGKKVKMKSIIKQLQSSGCLIIVKILMREDM